MMLHRRKFLGLAAAAVGCLAFSPPTSALDYPTRPVHFIVSFAAGGPNDTIARMLSQYLSEYLGQQFVVENRVGAGGNIGMEVVLSSPPDGYTIGFVAPNNAINTTLYEHLPFDFLRDSTPVAGTMKLANVMDVNLSFPAKNLVEFIAMAKADPGKINFASGGVGTSPHMSGRAFAGNGRHQAHARALSRHGARDDGFARRSGTGAFRQSAGLNPADPGRPNPRARRDHGKTRRHVA